MLYCTIVYFSWIVGLSVWLWQAARRSRRSGLVPLLFGIALQLGAYGLHLYESLRLAGEPDAIYAWIAPLLIAVIGKLLWLAGLVMQWRGRPVGASSAPPSTTSS